MIRTYQADHGGTVFYATSTRRQKAARTRLLALSMIAAVAASAGVVEAFNARASQMEAFASSQDMR